MLHRFDSRPHPIPRAPPAAIHRRRRRSACPLWLPPPQPVGQRAACRPRPRSAAARPAPPPPARGARRPRGAPPPAFILGWKSRWRVVVWWRVGESADQGLLAFLQLQEKFKIESR
ncbi:hypothetical protein U9M48_013977 [Paspalum notatum var. saurae]|uniref:Uncharacterized protein n=1 Tax=Paspalum notatum var. saurae TaxID=547442 RepID=A0AAQ3WK33_PASNO